MAKKINTPEIQIDLPGSFCVFRLLDAHSFSNPALTRQLINSMRASSSPASTAVSSTSSVVIAGKRVSNQPYSAFFPLGCRAKWQNPTQNKRSDFVELQLF
jgi:hypothetical protein